MAFTILIAAVAMQEQPTRSVSGWEIRDNRGSCSAITAYDSDVLVRIAYYPSRDMAVLSLFSSRWRSISAGEKFPLRIDFSNDRFYNSQDADGLVIGDGDDALFGVTTGWNGNEFLSDFAGAAGMEITVRETRLGRFSLGGTRQMVTALVRCAEQSFRSYPGDPFEGAGSPPRSVATTVAAGTSPVRLRSGSISNADYPSSAIRSGAQGTSRITISVGADGSVTGCTVNGSSGNSALDSTACSLAQRRFRFTPATRNGQPVASSYSTSIRWVLPEPPVPAHDTAAGTGTAPHPHQPLTVPPKR